MMANLSKYKYYNYFKLKTFVRYLSTCKNNYKYHIHSAPSKNLPKTINVKEFPKVYDPKIVEDGWYKWWESQGYFLPNHKRKQVFGTFIPPPNITGFLHLGHVLTTTIEDILIRWRRQLGDNVVWIPGIDHAGIATQVVVEKALSSQFDLSRHDLGKEKFLEKIWEWHSDKKHHIENQLRQLGLSLDWSRFIFTLDEKSSNIVDEAFITLFKKGLIYREYGIVNWSCVLQSTISDIEIEDREFEGLTQVTVPNHERPVNFGQLFHFAYPELDGQEEIIVATTRPETMLGDVAIAVHPNDNRYHKFIGKHFSHPFRKDITLPLILDESVDPEFGTGAVKITPAHSQVDFEIGKRHKLPLISIMDEKGRIINAGKFDELLRYEARDEVIMTLEKLGLMRSIKNHKVNVPFCSRSGDVIEYLVKPQWYLSCKEMAAKAKENVIKGSLTIEPKIYEEEWFNWLSNIRDWCISRQIWWGHRIPVYHCKDKGNKNSKTLYFATRNEEEARQKALSEFGIKNSQQLEIKQDEDVLDTWFSSGLIPLIACDWPKMNDLRKFLPFSMIDTGHDILFFWIARMVMLSLELNDQLPFKNIFLHGMVIDSFGRKMSKSLGNLVLPEHIINGINLQELHSQVLDSYESHLISGEELSKAIDNQKELYPSGIPECGTDALRFTLSCYNVTNKTISFNTLECINNRHFCNKLWQASRYVHNYLDRHGIEECLKDDWDSSFNNFEEKNSHSGLNKWIASRLAFMVHNVNKSLTHKEFHKAAIYLRKYFIEEFCSLYLESTKLDLIKKIGNKQAVETSRVLLKCLRTGLIALSPFMPFVTEELYHRLPNLIGEPPSVMIHPYPIDAEWSKYRDLELEEKIEIVLFLRDSLRKLLVIHNLNKESEVYIISEKNGNLFERYKNIISKLTGIKNLKINDKHSDDLFKERLNQDCMVVFNLKKDFQNEKEKLLKKEEKLNIALRKYLDIQNSSGFKIKASEKAKNDYANKITRLKKEINSIHNILRSLEN